ncbi:MAG: phosphodiesterase [Chromatiales bacterium]|nr:phosphodiesterase [Chromatiales bacterium]
MSETDAPLRVLHLTDPHLHADEEASLRGVVTNRSFDHTLAHALQHRWDVILVTGDLVQDDSIEAYRRFRDALAGVGVPVLVCAGNHDVPAHLQECLTASPFNVGGTLDSHGWRLVLLDSWLPDEPAGEIPWRELERLRTLLSGSSLHTLVALHHHPVAVGSRWLDRLGLRNAAELFAILEENPQVRGLLWGHVHQDFDQQRGRLRLLSSPSTCAQFLPGSDVFAIDDRPPGYRSLELHADGSIATEITWVPA